jgi:hypothetical protein
MGTYSPFHAGHFPLAFLSMKTTHVAFVASFFFLFQPSNTYSAAFSGSPDAQTDRIRAQIDAYAASQVWQKDVQVKSGIVVGLGLATGSALALAVRSPVVRTDVPYITLGAGLGMALGSVIASFIELPMEKDADTLFASAKGLTGQARLNAHLAVLEERAKRQRTERYWAGGFAMVLGAGISCLAFNAPTQELGLVAGPALISAGAVAFLVRGIFEEQYESVRVRGSLAEAKPSRFRVALSPMGAVGVLRF